MNFKNYFFVCFEVCCFSLLLSICLHLGGGVRERRRISICLNEIDFYGSQEIKLAHAGSEELSRSMWDPRIQIFSSGIRGSDWDTWNPKSHIGLYKMRGVRMTHTGSKGSYYLTRDLRSQVGPRGIQEFR